MNSQPSSKNRRHSTPFFFAAIIFASVLAAGGAAGAASVASPALYNVQLLVTTSSQLQYQYYYSAYNLTGSLVATYQSPYAAASFELPAGSYLFTVSAINQQSNYCNLCAQPMTGGAGSSGYAIGGKSSGNGTSSTGTAIIGPILPPYRLPSSEYGFRVEQVTGPLSFSVTTLNTTAFPTTPVTVSVQYANGTAAANVSVSASVVGEWFYWWGPNSTAVMSGQTDSGGRVNLVLPSAPAVVSAWDWVQVNLPASQKSVQVIIGGEKLNVTAYWQPAYVGLAASALLLPPATTLSLTLHYQQPTFWAMQAGGLVAPSSNVAVSNSHSGIPVQAQLGGASQYYLPSVIPPIAQVPNANGTSSSPAWGSAIVLAIAVSVIVVVAIGVVLFALRRRHSP